MAISDALPLEVASPASRSRLSSQAPRAGGPFFSGGFIPIFLRDKGPTYIKCGEDIDASQVYFRLHTCCSISKRRPTTSDDGLKSKSHLFLPSSYFSVKTRGSMGEMYGSFFYDPTSNNGMGAMAAPAQGARSFRGQKILQPGHPHVLFSSKKLTCFSCRPQNTGRQRRFRIKIKHKAVKNGNIFIFCSHYYWSKAIRRAVDLPTRSLDLARPGVAPWCMSSTRSGSLDVRWI